MSVAGTYETTVKSPMGDQKGTLTVNPAQLSVTATDATGTYGEAEPAYDFTVTGMAAWDTPAIALGADAKAALDTTVTGSAWGYSLMPGMYENAVVVQNCTPGVNPELVAAVLTKSRLRAKAHAKFGDFARHLVFTRDGVEQATRWSVAALHAQRFRAAGATRVADLGCGIGGDALAMAEGVRPLE